MVEKTTKVAKDVNVNSIAYMVTKQGGQCLQLVSRSTYTFFITVTIDLLVLER